MFIPILERTVEGRHSEVKRATLHARHHSGAYVSNALRLKEVMARSAQSSSLLGEVQGFLSKCRFPLWTLKHLKLRSHPQVASLSAEDIPEALEDKVTYRLDASTQFVDYSSCHAFEPDAASGHAAPAPPSTLGDASHVLKWAALDHFRETASVEDWFAAALPRSSSSASDPSPLRSLADALSGPPLRPAHAALAGEGHNIDFEEEPGACHASLDEASVSHGSLVLPQDSPMAWFTLFKVQHFHPTRLRRARGDTSTHLRRDDIALTLFRVVILT